MAANQLKDKLSCPGHSDSSSVDHLCHHHSRNHGGLSPVPGRRYLWTAINILE